MLSHYELFSAKHVNSCPKFDGVLVRGLRPTEIRQIAGRTGRFGVAGAENCFVSASSSKMLKYITDQYHQPDEVKKAYVGLDFEMFSGFPESMSVLERVLMFEKVDFILDKLKDIVRKENVGRYKEIAEMVNRKQFCLHTKWTLLTAPVKENNKSYFSATVDAYARNGIIRPPVTEILSEIREYEDKISEIELYLNLSRVLNHDNDEREWIMQEKVVLISQLSQMLLDKKLSVKKKCKTCTTMLALTYPYPYCEPCYMNSVRNHFDDDGWF